MAVDDSMVAFKGRTSMMQYLPAKSHKWGLKAWCVADSVSGYMYNWELYTGKSNRGPEVGLAHDVVMRITEPIHDEGHVVYMDNFFSSPGLFSALAEKQTGACGTVRVNRRGIPDSIKTAKFGDPPIFERDDKLLYVAWCDKRQVNAISTVHNSSTFTKQVCSKNVDRRQVEKPRVIELYSQYMGGVDRVFFEFAQNGGRRSFSTFLKFVFLKQLGPLEMKHPDKKITPDKYRLAVIEIHQDGLLSTISWSTLKLLCLSHCFSVVCNS